LDSDLPKIIWFLWLQGLAGAPLVVRKCYHSWVKHNPDWQIIFLDKDHITDHIDLRQDDKTQQAFSDILRINLLAKYGGVWVDATCYCNQSLDQWLPGYMGIGFFAFDRPGPDRKISSWFIAAKTDNYLIRSYKDRVNAYWNENPRLTFFESSKWFFLKKYLQRMGPQIWFSHIVLKVLRVYPYFWFHYLFENIYLKDSEFRQAWDGAAKFSADIPHRLQTIGLFSQLTEEVKLEIDQIAAPVYKLTWKYEAPAHAKGSVIDHLLTDERPA
jgi:hypothetical protein